MKPVHEVRVLIKEMGFEFRFSTEAEEEEFIARVGQSFPGARIQTMSSIVLDEVEESIDFLRQRFPA